MMLFCKKETKIMSRGLSAEVLNVQPFQILSMRVEIEILTCYSLRNVFQDRSNHEHET